MSAIAELELQVDSDLQKDSKLLNAIHEATNFFESQYHKEAGDINRFALMKWESKQNGTFTIKCTFTEKTGEEKHVSPRWLTVRQLLDQPSRNYIMLSMFRDILKQRIEERSVVIRNMLEQISSEEENANAPHPD